MCIFSFRSLNANSVSCFCGFSKTLFVKACETSSSSEHQTSSSSLSSRAGRKIRKPLVSVFFYFFVLSVISLSPPLSPQNFAESGNDEARLCHTHTAAGAVIFFFFLSVLLLFLLPLTVFSSAAHSHTLCICLCVLWACKDTGMCRSKRDELNGEAVERKDLGCRGKSCQTHYFLRCSCSSAFLADSFPAQKWCQ